MSDSATGPVTRHASGSVEFTDAAGTRWVVSVIPRFDFSERLMALLPHPERRGGWLLFESQQGERRRLAPIPDHWEALSAGELEQRMRAAQPSGFNERRRRSDTP